MSSVDNRIVNMQFNNKQFQSGAADSVQALDTLESTISNVGSGGGLENMGASIDNVSTRFGALQIAGVAALATIASQATSAALSLGGDLLGAVTGLLGSAGFSRSIDLQQAAFQFRGLGLDVKEVMENATDAVEGTSFALNEAAGVASQFAGGGVKAGQDMETALRGVAGVAAQTGRSYKEIGEIFAGVAATGKLSTMDLFQFQTRNLDVTGALADELGKTQNEIRAMVSAGQIDFETFSTAMDNAFGKNAAKANRTFTGALANMKTAVTRIGAGFFTPILKPAGDIFNALGEAIKKVQAGLGPDGLNLTGSFGKVAEAVSGSTVKFIESIHVMHLLGPIIQGIKNIFSPLVALFHTIGEAWLEVFPSQEHQSRRVLFTLATAFELITKPLAWLAELIPHLTPLFVGLFEVLRIGWTIVAGLGSVLGEVFAKAQEIGSNLVGGIFEGMSGEDISAKVIEFANNIIEWIKNALGIHSPADTMIPIGKSIVEGIGEGVLATVDFVLEAMGKVALAIINGFKQLFGDFDALDWVALFNGVLAGGVLLAVRSFVKTLQGFIGGLDSITKTISAPFSIMTESLKTMQSAIRVEMIKAIALAVGILTASIVALSLLDPKKAAIGLGFLASELGVVVAAMAAIGKFVNPAGIVASAAAIVLVSSATLILAGALAALGQLNPDKIGQALTTMAIGLGLMVGSLAALGAVGPATLAGGAGLYLLASALLVLTAALAVMAKIGPKKMSQGLTSMAVALTLMTASIAALGAIGPEVLAGGGAILILAVAIGVLAAAFVVMAKVGPKALSQGLTTMAVALTEMAVAIGLLSAIGPEVLAGAGAIYIVSVAMIALAKALEIMGGVGAEKMSQGLVTMAVALGIFLAAAAIAAIGPISIGLGVLALSMLAFGAGVALLGVGLLAAATAFAIFTAIFAAGTGVIVAGIGTIITLLPALAQQLALALVVFIQSIAAAAPELRKAFGKIISSALGTVRDAIPEMRKLATELLDALFDVVHHQMDNFRRLISDLIDVGLAVIKGKVDDFVDTGVAVIEAFLRGVRDNLDNIIRIGTQIIANIIKGIGDSANKLLHTTFNTIIKFGHDLADLIRNSGEPIRDVGLDIASAIVEGIADGLGAQAAFDLVKNAAIALADSLPGWMQKVLEMASPSKVAMRIGEQFVAGLVIGISDHIANAVGVTIQLANAVIAAGDKVVAKAQRQSRKEQIAAAKKQARADLSARFAKEAEREARQSPKNKELQQQAKDARKIADAQQKAADEAQRRADAASQRVEDVKAFREADDQGKGDILTARAEALTDRAIKKLAEANAAAKAAKDASGKERKRLLKEAREDAAASKRLADQSRTDQKRARGFFADAVKDRIESIRKEQKKEREAAQREREFEKADDEGKAAILQTRAETARKRADAARKQSEALIKQARALAKTDAARSQRLLDKAERLAQQAQDASDQAKADKQQADDLLNPDTTTGGTGVTLELSRSAMEDAAAAIDRHTRSLQQAEEAAQASEPVVQFVQYNSSPESLDPTAVYRQTKNLLTLAEIKMAEPVAP